MPLNRRNFVKLAGLTAVGVATGKPSKLFSQDPKVDLAPDKEPLVGSRWAMVIDLRKCREHPDCEDCAAACHKVHNVPHFDNRKDEIKWIWKEPFEHIFEEQDYDYLEEKVKKSPVLVLCNHCDNPPCTRVCPTQATWKRESDGIVMMDWHRCIGCRYCVVACPYGARSFNWRDPRPFIKDIQEDFPTRMRGVVEKCIFCEERLAKGQIPACVEACKYGAMTFGDLEDSESEVRRLLAGNYAIRRKPSLGTQPQIYYIV